MLRIIVLAVVASFLVSATQAAELVELSDKNQAILELDASKALDNVQKALTNEFRFEKVAEVGKFLDNCKYLNSVFASKSDEDYEGLAGKIKAILAQPDLAELCTIKRDLVEEFSELDKPYIGENLSMGTVQKMVEFNDRLEKHPKLKRVLGYRVESIKRLMGESLLQHAAEDVSLFFGEKNGYGYQSGCAIAALKPVCQLARRSNIESVQAIGRDFADFRKIVAEKDESKLSHHTESSGVSLDQLRDTCTSIKRNFLSMSLVDKYLDAKILDDQQIVEQANIDPDFDFYYQLYKLCSEV